jgi:hypothetical protein
VLNNGLDGSFREFRVVDCQQGSHLAFCLSPNRKFRFLNR